MRSLRIAASVFTPICAPVRLRLIAQGGNGIAMRHAPCSPVESSIPFTQPVGDASCCWAANDNQPRIAHRADNHHDPGPLLLGTMARSESGLVRSCFSDGDGTRPRRRIFERSYGWEEVRVGSQRSEEWNWSLAGVGVIVNVIQGGPRGLVHPPASRTNLRGAAVRAYHGRALFFVSRERFAAVLVKMTYATYARCVGV